MLNRKRKLDSLLGALGLTAAIAYSQSLQALNFGNNDVGNPRTNAVVFVDARYDCTGTLIAPDVVITAGHCIAGRGEPHEDALPQCADWQIPGHWYPLTSSVTISVGHDQRRFSFVTDAIEYTMPGCRDVMMLRLDEPVPDTEARPVPVLVSAGAKAGARDASRFASERCSPSPAGGSIRVAQFRLSGRLEPVYSPATTTKGCTSTAPVTKWPTPGIQAARSFSPIPRVGVS